jgi:hypothetical protein
MLNDNRPYIPGDDPRRINWKLYGHIGELFVRDNERENKLFTDAAFFIDTTIYTGMYTKKEYTIAIDRLCSALYAIFLKGVERSVIIHASFTDIDFHSDTNKENKMPYTDLSSEKEIQTLLAYPYAIPVNDITKKINAPQNKYSAEVFTVSLSRTDKFKMIIEKGGVHVLSESI